METLNLLHRLILVTKALFFFTQATLQAEDTYQIVEEIPTENNEQGNGRQNLRKYI